MLWAPMESEEVVNAAWLEPLSAIVPSGEMPSRNVTLPVAVGETVAVKVTL